MITYKADLNVMAGGHRPKEKYYYYYKSTWRHGNVMEKDSL